MSTRQAATPISGLGPETLVFGIGNCGRSDDGLGWAFLDRLQRDPRFTGRIEYRYQLQVEDALPVSAAAHVVFVDSCDGDLAGGFRWASCVPARRFEFTTHALAPEAIMHLSQNLYGKAPPANLLMIQGCCWELAAGISPQAELHLDRALRFIHSELLQPR